MSQMVEVLENKELIFWDFDGVVKDSVEVKTDAFVRLFQPYGMDVANKVRKHHEANGGMSRYEKFPIYLGWAAEPTTPENIKLFCDRFAQMVRQSVIDAPWVPGVREYLDNNFDRQRFVLVTATPHEEILQILDALELTSHFKEVHGAPTSKADSIKSILQRWNFSPKDALMVGDAETDLKAAEMNHVDFLLRRTPLNLPLHDRCKSASFEHL